jgi:hypothetical protein
VSETAILYNRLGDSTAHSPKTVYRTYLFCSKCGKLLGEYVGEFFHVAGKIICSECHILEAESRE